MSTAATARNLDLPNALADARARYARANPSSEQAYRQACQSLPGGNTRTILYYPPFPLTIARAQGATVWDADGHAYDDFVGEYSAGLYGHSHPVIMEAARQALDGGIVFCGPNRFESELAALICARFASCDRLRFTNSGTEANLLAITAARAFTKRSDILVFDGGYHGGVLLFNTPGGNAVNAPYPFIRAPYNDIDGTLALIEANHERLAAVLLEPMMGSAGAIPAERAFLAALREASTRHGMVLIFDEVMTSRLSPGGLQQVHGVVPDMTTFGKYMGGGFTFGAFGGRADIVDQFDPRRADALPHAGTFNNNVLTMAAGVAGLKQVWTEQAASALNARGDRFREQINTLFKSRAFPAQATGTGSMLAIHPTTAPIRSPRDLAHIDADAKALLQIELLNAGCYVGRMGLMSLSLPLEERAYDAFLAALEGFVQTYAGLWE
jgi:glutamate-1-semialdehyde 2,1-aminomutase